MKNSKKMTALVLSVITCFGLTGQLIPYTSAGNTACFAAESTTSDNSHEYEDLYELRLEIDKNPTNPYYDAGTRDFSGLEVSVYSVGADGNETKVMSNVSLEELKAMYDVNIIEVPGGGAFSISISAYSTTLNKTISDSAEFYMEKIANDNITALRSEIVTLPKDTIKHKDAELDLSGLTLSVWETTNDGTETQIFTDADLETIKKRYTIHIYCELNDNGTDGICHISILTFVYGREIKTTSTFEFKIDDAIPTIKKGDVNDDGEFNVADVVTLQKWLLAEPDVELNNWKAADLCEDDRLDVFDLCLMKRELVATMNNTYPVENPEVIDEFTPCTATIDDVFDDWSICVVIKCQYSVADKKWTKEDFDGVENIRIISQRETFKPHRHVLDISLEETSKENVLKLVHDIESLGLADIKEIMVVSHGFGAK